MWIYDLLEEKLLYRRKGLGEALTKIGIGERVSAEVVKRTRRPRAKSGSTEKGRHVCPGSTTHNLADTLTASYSHLSQPTHIDKDR